MLHSDDIPNVDYSPDINDLFMYFGMNWETLSPALWLLFGTLLAFFFLGLLVKFYKSE